MLIMWSEISKGYKMRKSTKLLNRTRCQMALWPPLHILNTLLLLFFSIFTKYSFKMKTVSRRENFYFTTFPSKFRHLTTINANDSVKQHIYKRVLN